MKQLVTTTGVLGLTQIIKYHNKPHLTRNTRRAGKISQPLKSSVLDHNFCCGLFKLGVVVHCGCPVPLLNRLTMITKTRRVIRNK